MNENDQEFLRALHEEKIRTQNERAELVTRKLTFITVLFGLSSVNLGIEIADICWLLYFIPLVAISYDLYTMSADSRIKRIGVFLGRHPVSAAWKAEREWEHFCTTYRDGLGPSANMFVSIIVTVCAAVFVHSQQTLMQGYMRLWFAFWLVASLAAIIALWMRHKVLIRNLGDYEPLRRERLPGP
jgi:ABC-type glycerol-3-phosphate transport system permease component